MCFVQTLLIAVVIWECENEIYVPDYLQLLLLAALLNEYYWQLLLLAALLNEYYWHVLSMQLFYRCKGAFIIFCY